MTTEQRRHRAEQAQQLQENPVFAEAMATLAARITSEWSHATEPERREQLWCDFQASRRLEKFLKKAIRDGQNANQEIVQRGNDRKPNHGSDGP